jgi:hypothetical protein
MKAIGMLPILIDRSKMRRIKITCRCSRHWIEDVPSEVHDSWLVMAFFCPSCGSEYHLQNKKLERAEQRSSKMPRTEWPVPDGPGGNA